MVSTYRWKGAVEQEAERQIVIKTTRARLPALEARLASCIRTSCRNSIVIAGAEGSEEYVQWVRAETQR